MNKTKTIFISGATGFLGSYLMKLFLLAGCKVYALSRPKKNKSAEERILTVLKFWNLKNLSKLKDKLVVVEGDITEENLNIDNKKLKQLLYEVDEVFHSAAITNLNYPLEEIRKINVGGTENVLKLALSAKNPVKVNHISTAFIYGDYRGDFTEKTLELGQKFNTTYEKSKFEAEQVACLYRKKGLWVDIYRPPIIVADSKNGKAFSFRNVYQLLHICSLGLFKELPVANPYINIVPIDWLSKAILVLSLNDCGKNNTYHPFPSEGISVSELISTGCNIIGIGPPKIVKLKDFNMNKLTVAEQTILRHSIVSLEFKAHLNSKATLEILKKHNFVFPEINQNVLNRILSYYVKKKLLISHTPGSLKQERFSIGRK